MNSVNRLLEKFNKSLDENTFVKLTLSKPKKKNSDLRNIYVRLVKIKDREKLSIVSHYEKKDETQNYLLSKGKKHVGKYLMQDFSNANLFTINKDYQLEGAKLKTLPPKYTHLPSKSHDKQKTRAIPFNRPFLKILEMTNPEGSIKKDHLNKYKQICSFVDIFSRQLKKAELMNKSEISVADMGCGSAYLTFAIYDFLKNSLNKKVDILGVDVNSELITRNNKRAKEAGFGNLHFVTSSIEDFGIDQVDILVALHACDTATDQAIYKGINAKAAVIICSPCCHQEIRPRMNSPKILKDVLKHGVFAEDMAEMLTDTLRALILNYFGYVVEIYEFVSDEHSAKNNIIVATKKKGKIEKSLYLGKIKQLKEFFGIKDFYLERVLNVMK